MLKKMTSLTVGLLLCATAYGQTADECIVRYKEIKEDFVASGAAFAPNCNHVGNIHNLFVDSESGQLPPQCDPSVSESGGWDHWHLEARALVGKDSHCSLMLRGLIGQDGCGFDEEEIIYLPANEAVKWRKYLDDECEQ